MLKRVGGIRGVEQESAEADSVATGVSAAVSRCRSLRWFAPRSRADRVSPARYSEGSQNQDHAARVTAESPRIPGCGIFRTIEG